MTSPGLSKLRKQNRYNLSLTIPHDMSVGLEKAGMLGTVFQCELIDDGILFRLVDVAKTPPPMPAWASQPEDDIPAEEGEDMVG